MCPDAAGTNDDGILNIGDAIHSLYLFSGETIPYPYPDTGGSTKTLGALLSEITEDLTPGS